MNPYEVLGLEEGAQKDQVKRAYFRLLREHSPEHDPEGFARIREAYERLTNPEEGSGGPAIPLPDHPYAKMFADQIEQCIEIGNWELARDTAQEGLERFQGSLYFLYRLAYTQRHCSNTGKAAKNAELLVKKEPENRWFWRELALSYYERGYIRKAFPAFQKAYDLGCKDVDFVMMFSMDCLDCDCPEEAKRILMPFSDPSHRWTQDHMAEALELYSCLFHAYCELGEDCDGFARDFAAFLRKYRLWLAACFDRCMTVIAAVIMRDADPGTTRICIEAMEEVNQKEQDSSRRKDHKRALDRLHLLIIGRDEKICRSLQYLSELLVVGDEQNRPLMTDCRLCMIEEREQILGQENYVRETYPEFYEKTKPYLDKIRTERDAEKLKYRLLQEFRKIVESYDGGWKYLRWFPERRELLFGKQVISSEETFVRVGKKIGRNDPCPCGSGKKYKFCCGRN